MTPTTTTTKPLEVRVPLTVEQIRSLADACEFFGAGADAESLRYWGELASKLRVFAPGEDG